MNPTRFTAACIQMRSGRDVLRNRDAAVALVREAADKATQAGAGDVDTFCKAGDPVDVLVSAIEERKADLIVVGNRGLNSLAGRLLGSVPSGVLHRAACDVLIARTTDGGR